MSDSIEPFRILTDLQWIEQDCWKHLSAAVDDRDCGWRLPVMATTTLDGVCQRTLVLRRVCNQTRTLQFHTDVRSHKITHLQHDARVSLLFYDHARSVQMQIRGKASLHRNDSIADALWNDSPPESLRGYLAPQAPGTFTPKANINLPIHVQGRIPDRSEIEPGKVNFVVIEVHTHQADWLHLSRDGNIRARFIYEQGQPQGQWLTP